MSGNGDCDETTTTFPECPRCGDPLLATVVTGPSSATGAPCGCSVPPPHLEDE